MTLVVLGSRPMGSGLRSLLSSIECPRLETGYFTFGTPWLPEELRLKGEELVVLKLEVLRFGANSEFSCLWGDEKRGIEYRNLVSPLTEDALTENDPWRTGRSEDTGDISKTISGDIVWV